MARGSALNEEEYQRLVLAPTKRSTSMYESCLLPPKMRPQPRITAQNEVADSLKRDEEAFRAKYGGKLDGEPERLAEHCQYGKTLPSGPVHMKYTLAEALANRPPELKDEKVTGTHGRPRFQIPTIRKWFTELDADGGGHVSRREMIVALQNHRELREVLLSTVCEVKHGLADAENDRDVQQAKNAELRRIMAIMRELDQDNSGSLDWDEFVEFFRRSGFLLEYDTHEQLNVATFKEAGGGLMSVSTKAFDS